MALSYFIIVTIIIISHLVLSQGEEPRQKEDSDSPLALWAEANHLTFLNLWFLFCNMVTMPVLLTFTRS